MSENNSEVVIPEEKIRAAHAKCMLDPALAKYFNEAPPGARQYIALMFYCTVYQSEVDDARCELYQAEVEEDLTKEDLLYLATHERNPDSKAHFRELYTAMTEAEENAAETGAAPAAGAESLAELVRIEKGLFQLRDEVQQLRRIAAAQAARRSQAPGALALGGLSAVLSFLSIVAPFGGKPLLLALSACAAILGLSAATRRAAENLAPRIIGAVFAIISLVTGLCVLFYVAVERISHL